MDDGLLKIPVQLTKISSKKGRDNEAMWVIQVETHQNEVQSINALTPFIDHYFVMVLVKVEDRKEIKEQMEGEINLEEGGECRKPQQKKATKKRKQSKRAR